MMDWLRNLLGIPATPAAKNQPKKKEFIIQDGKKIDPETGAWTWINEPTPTARPTPQGAVLGAMTIPQNPQATPTPESFAGFRSTMPKEASLTSLIESAAQSQNLNVPLLAALIAQETGRFRPDVIYGPGGFGEPGRQDFGAAQINEYWHPEVTRQQALDPNFAIPFAARKLRSDIDYFGGNINRGVAAYNVGRGGANNNGQTASGLGPKGQFYLDNVLRNIDDSIISQLGGSPSANFR